MGEFSGLKDQWRELGARERRWVVFGAAALLTVLFYFMVWSPFVGSVENSRQRVGAGLETVIWMQGKAAEARGLQAALGDLGKTELNLSGSFLSFVEDSARKAGLGEMLKGTESTGDDKVLLKFEKAPFNVFLAWMNDLHSKGVDVSTVALDREQELGKVRVRLVLGRSGG